MTIDERLEALTARHEALTMSVELMQAKSEKFDRDLRRLTTLGVRPLSIRVSNPWVGVILTALAPS